MKHQAYRIDGSKEKKVKRRAPAAKDTCNDPSGKKEPYRYWCKNIRIQVAERENDLFILPRKPAEGRAGLVAFQYARLSAPAASALEAKAKQLLVPSPTIAFQAQKAP